MQATGGPLCNEEAISMLRCSAAAARAQAPALLQNRGERMQTHLKQNKTLPDKAHNGLCWWQTLHYHNTMNRLFQNCSHFAILRIEWQPWVLHHKKSNRRDPRLHSRGWVPQLNAWSLYSLLRTPKVRVQTRDFFNVLLSDHFWFALP